MGRKPFFLLLVLLMLLGFVGGYLLRVLAEPAAPPVSTVPYDDTADAVPDEPLPGFCCMQRGSVCDVSESPSLCLEGGGWVYHQTQSRCDEICAALLE